MRDPAGSLQIRIGAAGTTIGSSRPVRAARVFIGKGPAETARLLPALFSICATAQSAACVGALEQAQGLAPHPSEAALRGRLVDAETLREHLWRILLDWPRILDLEPDPPAMARVMDGFVRLRAALTSGRDPVELGPFELGPFELASAAAVAEPEAGHQAWPGLNALVEQRVLGRRPPEWLASVRGFDALAAWCGRTDTPAARLLDWLLAQGLADLGRAEIGALPELDSDPCFAELEARLGGPGADAFVAQPVWDGEPRETSSLTRNLDAPLIQDMAARFGNGILTRLAAQLLEVARIASRFETAEEVETAGFRARGLGSPPPQRLEPGVGLSQVPAARGLLVHRVRVAGQRVTDYRILAPTEWNFHPQGVVAAGLDALAARLDGTELEPLARLFIAAVDPCVDFDLVRT